VNLFSLNKALKKGFKLSNDGIIVSLNFKHVKLTFDRIINATDGCVTGLSMKPMMSNNINGFANASISSVVRHNGMDKHSVPMYRVYIF
jgi:hypothetical protein